MKKRSSIGFFGIMVFVIPLTAYAIFHLYESRLQKLPVIGEAKEVNGKKVDHRIGDFRMQNQEGQWKTVREWDKKIVVANFFFTHCPVVCPKMTANLKRVEAIIADDPGVRISSFSVDPERDSVTQLKTYAKRFDIHSGKWDLLTGDKKEIYKLARNSFMIVATDGDGGPLDFIHSEKLVLVDRQGRIRGYYEGTNSNEVDQLLIDIKKLKDED